MAILTVGSGKDYSTINAAYAASSQGDEIQIYAGTYDETGNTWTGDGRVFSCGTGSDDLFEEVLLSGSSPDDATSRLADIYGGFHYWYNLTFTAYCTVPGAFSGMVAECMVMSGCHIYDCGDTNTPTIYVDGWQNSVPAMGIDSSNPWTGSLDSCVIYSMQHRAVSSQGNSGYCPIEVNNCLIVSDSPDDTVLELGALGNAYTTASFCTVIGRKGSDGALVDAAQVIGCIVSGTSGQELEVGSAGWVGCGGIYAREISASFASVDTWGFFDAGGTNYPKFTGSATPSGEYIDEWNNVSLFNAGRYFTNSGTIGTGSYFTDDYTLTGSIPILTASAICYYTFEDGSGTTLTDHSGRGHTGTITGATWSTTHKVGTYSLSFDGTDDYVSCDSVCDDIADSDFSIAFWLKSPTVTSYDSVFSFQTSDATPAMLCKMHPGSGAPLFFFGNGSTSLARVIEGVTVFGSQFIVSEWRHFVMTYDNTTKLASFWVDGLPIGSILTDDGSDPPIAITTSSQFTLGADERNGVPDHENFFDGYLDELGVWPQVLEPEHIRMLYQKGLNDESLGPSLGKLGDTTYSNPAVGAGPSGVSTALFGPVITDVSGALRLAPPTIGAYEYFAPVPYWSEYFSAELGEAGYRYNRDLVSLKYIKYEGDFQYKAVEENRQPPFSVGIPGVPSLRRRATPYSSSI